MRLRQIYIFIAMVFAGLAVQAILASPASAAVYFSQGIATSTNLLSGSSASSITNFHYNIATLPATSSVRIQFSKDNTNWFSSGGTPGGWDTLALGQADLSLTAFVAASSWTNGDPFYYKLEINSTADLSATPTIDDIRLDYTPNSGYENVFVFDNYGNVGIGTTSPSGKLDIHGAGTTTGINTQWSDSTGAAKVSILDNGNVGIGTTNPGEKLEVNGAIHITSATPNSTSMALYNNAGTLTWNGVALATGGSSISGTANYIPIFTGAATLGNSAIYQTGGNVGIGTTIPSALLDVNGSTWLRGVAGGTSGLYVNNGGNVGIGTTSPSGRLDIHGVSTGTGINTQWADSTGAAKVTILDNGNVGIGTTSPGYKLEVYTGSASGWVVTATGAWGNSSDERLKKNIVPMHSAVENVMALNPVTYNMKTESNSDPTHFGFIAQEVEKISPDLVSTGPGGMKGLSYAMFAPLLTKAIQEQQGLIVEQQAKNTRQDTQISDVNLKTSQNVETVGQLQKSVDENLVVISNNFSTVQTQMALHDSELASSSAEEAGQNAKIADIDSRLTDLNNQYAILDTKYNILDTKTGLNEAEKADLESRLTAAEASLLENENNLITFEKGTNDTLSAMLDTENMLTDQVISQGTRIKILEDKLATMTVSAGGEIPSNVLTKDALGNVALAGVFEAKEVIAGAFSVKNETGTTAPTMGDVIINPLPVDADGDGIDDATNAPVIPSDGKTVKISTKAVSDTSKIMVTPVGLTPVNWIVSSVEKGVSFTITLDKETAASVKFNWWIVEEK